MAEQPVNMNQEQAATPEAMRNAMAGEQERNQNPDGQQAAEIHERFVVNVMKLASGNEYDNIMSIMRSVEDPAQGFARALFFILEAVSMGLKEKEVNIPGELWLTENGLIEQSARIIAILGTQAGIQLDEQSITQGMNLAAEAIADLDSQAQMSEVEGQQAMPQDGVPPEEPEQQAMPQGGLLSQSGGM